MSFSSVGAIDAAGAEPGREVGGRLDGGSDTGGSTGAEAAGAEPVGGMTPSPEPPSPVPLRPWPLAPGEPTPGEIAAPPPTPWEPPPKSFMPRMLPGSDPADGAEEDGNVPTGGMVGEGPTPEPEAPTPEPPKADDSPPRDPPAAGPVGEPVPAAEPERGWDPTLELTEPVDGAPVCPTRGAAAPDGPLGGRAAAGVPPPSNEEAGADPVEAPAAGRVAAGPDVPVGPIPALGAAATRGEPKLLGAEGFVAAGELAGAVARLLAPKLGGAVGEADPAPAPAGGIVGTVDSPTAWKSESPENEDEGGGPAEGSKEPPELT